MDVLVLGEDALTDVAADRPGQSSLSWLLGKQGHMPIVTDSTQPPDDTRTQIRINTPQVTADQ